MIIHLTQNKQAQVDLEDFERVNNLKWFYIHGYAGRQERNEEGKQRVFFLHRFIVEAPKNMVIDHINGDRLDNRKINLRITDRTGNNRNSKVRKNNKLGIKGVFFDKNKNRFIPQISVGGRKVFLGEMKNVIDASRAYDNAAKKYFGEFAKLNNI